jgi:dimethylhistidine N-methyltransferase
MASLALPPNDEVLDGLRRSPRTLPCRLLWDARGAQLFGRICTVEDYYLTRHELALMRAHLPTIAEAIGARARVIEPGSGLAQKTRLLLDALVAPSAYVPIEVEAEQLALTTAGLRTAYPDLVIEPVCADYMHPVELPQLRSPAGRNVVFFPGSTIGNFELADAEAFLARFARLAGDDSMLVLGADSNGDADALVRAYDDRDGVTAEFDRNVLDHVNRICDADFDPATFDHRAVWDPRASRIEMHLVSRAPQRVHVAGHELHLAEGEPIVTEHCYKYPVPVLEALLARAGWRVREIFADANGWMRLWLCSRA